MNKSTSDPSVPFMRKAWEDFALLIVEGKTASDAYREAYPKSLKWKASTVHRKAHTMMGKVGARVSYLRQQVTSDKVIDIQRRKEILSDMATGKIKKSPDDYDPLSPIQELNKMDGVYKQTNTELPVGNGVTIIMHPPRERI